MTEPRSTLPRRTALGGLLAALLASTGAGCHTWRPPPIDLAAPGWNVLRGQAVWHPARRDVELAGDVLLAVDGARAALVQFTKGPAVIAEARTDGNHWLAGFPAMHRTYSGPGHAPTRLAWNQLLRVALHQELAPGWTWSGSLTQQWRLAHESSGEWIEGTRLP